MRNLRAGLSKEIGIPKHWDNPINQPAIFNTHRLVVPKVILCLAMTLFTLTGISAASLSRESGAGGIYSDEQIVEAIGKAENSVKYPYGIKSIDTKSNAEYARKICFNSVRNGRARWIKAGKPCDLITFISKRYCPINATDDPIGLNKNWISNVKFYLRTKERGR